MHEPIRVLWARDHTTIQAGMGVFLAGPTPPEQQMAGGWRRRLIARLVEDPRLCPCMTVVAPEPEGGRWSDIEVETGRPRHDRALNRQIQWEWHYLERCSVTAFWLPTYWSERTSDPFPPNIGPTSRWEFGYYFARWEHNPHRYELVAGAPEDAESLKWPMQMVRSRGLTWHRLARGEKAQRVGASFVEAIVSALLRRKWCDCQPGTP